jgi:hypothetical protein
MLSRAQGMGGTLQAVAERLARVEVRVLRCVDRRGCTCAVWLQWSCAGGPVQPTATTPQAAK